MPQNNCVGGAEPTKEELIEDAMRSKLSVDFFYLIGGTDYNFQRHMLNFALYAPNLSGKPDPLEKMKGYFGKIYKGVKGKDGEQIWKFDYREQLDQVFEDNSMELDNAIPRAVSLYRDSSIKSKFDIPEYENEFESTAAQIISNSIKSTNGQKVLVTDEDCRNAFCNVVKAKIAELDESNISEVRHGAGKSQQKVVAEKKEMRPIEEDKDNELFINDEQLAHELQMNYIIEDSRLQYREEREAVRKLKRAEADKKAELHKQYAEISKTGVYLIENSNTIVRVLNDSHYQYDKYFGTEYNNGTEHTELIDADGGYLRAGLNIFHTGFSLAYGFYSHSVVPIVSTAVYTIKGNTDFLKSDNPYIQCFMDASTAPIAQLVTFNPYGAAITAGLGSAKCVLPESLQPVIRVAQNVNDLANSANVVIQTVEGVKFIYTMYDNFFINDEQLSESPDIHI